MAESGSVPYHTQHTRNEAARGKASLFKCVDCAERGIDTQARDWSYRHGTDPDDVMNYDPRCRRCHNAYDGSGHHTPHTEETKALLSQKNRGYKHTPEAVEKIRAAARNPSSEARAKMAAGGRKSGETRRARVRREELPPSRYSYDYRHDLAEAARGKARTHKCEVCAEQGIDKQAREWSQLHDRTGDDPWDYRPLCKKCHTAYDGSYPPPRPGGNPDIGKTRAAQQRAKTHCPQGHELTPDNIYWRGPGRKNRQCKTCARERSAARYKAQREAAKASGAEPKPSRRGGARPGTGDPSLGSRYADRQLSKTHCPAGHEYTPENTYIIKRAGGRTARQCKTCTRAKAAARRKAT